MNCLLPSVAHKAGNTSLPLMVTARLGGGSCFAWAISVGARSCPVGAFDWVSARHMTAGLWSCFNVGLTSPYPMVPAADPAE